MESYTLTARGKKDMSQSDEIIETLQRHRQGVLNTKLNRIAFRYSARIHELRKDGYDISCRYVKPGVFIYKLEDEDATQA